MSEDNPVITYHDRRTAVRLGDRVRTRIWFRKHQGTVVYLPGVSMKNPTMERDGLRWVGVRLDEGGFISCVIDPKGAFLRNRLDVVGHLEGGYEELAPSQEPHGGDSFLAP